MNTRNVIDQIPHLYNIIVFGPFGGRLWRVYQIDAWFGLCTVKIGGQEHFCTKARVVVCRGISQGGHSSSLPSLAHLESTHLCFAKKKKKQAHCRQRL